MKHSAEFIFTTPHAPVIYQALSPEMADETGERSSAAISLKDECLSLKVTAGDIPALRAALNMWLRLITIADEMQEIGYDGKPYNSPESSESGRSAPADAAADADNSSAESPVRNDRT